MCACADYVNVDLHIEVYAIISVVLGMWGLSIMKAILDKKIVNNFFKHIIKLVNNPLVKSVVETTSETIDEESKESEKKQQTNNETDKNK